MDLQIIFHGCLVPSPASFLKHQNMYCSKNTQQLRWRKFCCNRTASEEQSAISLATFWHWLQGLQTPTENISFRIDYSAAQLVLCALQKYSYLCTYLFTYFIDPVWMSMTPEMWQKNMARVCSSVLIMPIILVSHDSIICRAYYECAFV